MPIQLRSRLRILAITTAALMSCCWPGSTFAENTVTLKIVASGALNVGVVDGKLLPVDYSDRLQVVTGVLRLIIRDPRGTSGGWSVSITSSNFSYKGDSIIGRDIPSTGFRISAATAPRVIAGQPRSVGGPNVTRLIGASLEIPRTTIWAAPGAGSGDYEQIVAVTLDIPAFSEAGRYQAMLTLTVASAP